MKLESKHRSDNSSKDKGNESDFRLEEHRHTSSLQRSDEEDKNDPASEKKVDRNIQKNRAPRRRHDIL